MNVHAMHVGDVRVNALPMKALARPVRRVACTVKSVHILRIHNHGREKLIPRTRRMTQLSEGKPVVNHPFGL